MLVGIGVDVLEGARVRRELSRHGARFGASAFTAAEAAACERASDPATRYAECFAAKEAAWKTVGTSPPDTLALTLSHTRDHAIACVVAASPGA